MKFRARFGNASQLSKLVQTLDKVGDHCFVHLTPDNVSFAVVGDAGDGVQVWADMTRASLFLDHRCESRNNNQISFTTKVSNLVRALRSACANSNVQTVVKLTKKTGIPTFSFEIQQPQTQLKITHDVPIRLVLDDDELLRSYEPTLPDEYMNISASVVLPGSELRSLQNVVERMGSFATYMVVDITNAPSGHVLRLQVEKENLMNMTTTFSKLASAVQEDPSVSKTAEAKVEVKKLGRVLRSLLSTDLKVSQLICCIVPGHTVVLKCYFDNQDDKNTIVYYLPVHFLEP